VARHRGGDGRRGGDDGLHGRDLRRHPGVGNFTNSTGIAQGLAAYAGKAAGALFAVALLDASIIGAFAVSLSSAYAIGDVLGVKHSLHRGVKQAKGFYLVYAGLIGLAAAIVLIPGSPLGLLMAKPAATPSHKLLSANKALQRRPSSTTSRAGSGRSRSRSHQVNLDGETGSHYRLKAIRVRAQVLDRIAVVARAQRHVDIVGWAGVEAADAARKQRLVLRGKGHRITTPAPQE
jgi:hypothetical protein